MARRNINLADVNAPIIKIVISLMEKRGQLLFSLPWLHLSARLICLLRLRVARIVVVEDAHVDYQFHINTTAQPGTSAISKFKQLWN